MRSSAEHTPREFTTALIFIRMHYTIGWNHNIEYPWEFKNEKQKKKGKNNLASAETLKLDGYLRGMAPGQN